MPKSNTIASEIDHGKWLKEHDPVIQWGWGSPAGKLRAKRRAELIATGAELAPEKHAMEIGCGTGMFTEMFDAYGASILAVDLSPDLLELARKRALSPRVVFQESPFEQCEAQGPFDAIIGSSVLHHLECPSVFAKIHSLLKPGGIMSFCEPNMLNPQIWFTLRFRRFFPYISKDETAFYRTSVANMLKSVGFAEVRITPFDWLHPKVPSCLIPLIKGIEKIVEFIPGVKEFAGSLWIVAKKR